MATLSNPLYVRPLSPTERFNLVINEVCRYNVDAFVEGTGTLTREELQRAVDIAAAANPGTRVRLKGVLGFCKWVDSGIAPEVIEAPSSAWDGESELHSEFLQQKFDALHGGPVCDIILMPGNPMRIMFRVLHAAMDARGLQYFVHEIFKVLRNEPIAGSNSTLIDYDVADRYKDQIPEQPPVKACIPVIPRSKLSDKPLRYVWRHVVINNNVSNILPKLAVFLAQYARKNQSGNVGFTIPVDLRGLRADIQTTANMTGYLRLNIDEGDTPRTVMQHLNQRIRDHADCVSLDALKKLRWVPISFMASQLRKKMNDWLDSLPSGGLVSLGLFKPEDFTCPQFHGTRCIGIPGSVGKMNVVIMNHHDHTSVIFSTPAVYNSEGQLDQLIAEFKAHFDK